MEGCWEDVIDLCVPLNAGSIHIGSERTLVLGFSYNFGFTCEAARIFGTEW